MSGETTHIIHKLVVEVDTSTTKRGFELKNTARSFVDEYVIPAIEAYLKDLESVLENGETVEIQQLEIGLESDITDFSDRSWKKSLYDALEKSSGEVLKKVTERRAADADVLRSGKFREVLENERTVTADQHAQMVQGVRLSTEAARGLNAVFYFLETGLRPWWIAESQAIARLLEPDMLLEMIRKDYPLFRELYLRQINSHRTVRRWIGQLSDEVLEIVVSSIENVAPATSATRIQALDFHAFIEIDAADYKVMRQLFWEFVIVAAGREGIFNDRHLAGRFRMVLLERLGHRFPEKGTIVTGQNLSERAVAMIRWLHVLRRGEKQDAYYTQLLNELVSAVETQNPSPKLTGNDLPTAYPTPHTIDTDESLNSKVEPQGTNGSSEESEDTNHTSAITANGSPKPPSELQQEFIESTAKTEKQFPDEAEEQADFWERFVNDSEKIPEEKALPEEGLVVDNAGLVLLHPFLKYFFQDIGLLDEQEQLTDPYLAAHVLHFVATGKEQDYEHAMVFEKFLVNIPFYEVLPRSIEIPETVREKVKLLFNAVRTNWEPVNGTSDEGIRETFLAREGKLIITEDLIRLVVERKTVDILLEKLAWSLGMVHLPWKKTLIHVEW